MKDLTEDVLLGGRVRLIQPARGYRAATDPVLLAAACPARPGQSALDLGCGVGAAALCLCARVPGVAAQGLELQPDYAALARRNAALNDADFTAHEGDIAAPPSALKALSFDHVLSNPPYFETAARPSHDTGRDLARRESADVALWIDAGLTRLRQGGWLTLIHLTEKLPAILAALEGRAATVSVIPLAPRQGRAARRMIVTAKKDSRGPFRISAPFVIHARDRHRADEDDFTEGALAVLRDAAPLNFIGG